MQKKKNLESLWLNFFKIDNQFLMKISLKMSLPCMCCPLELSDQLQRKSSKTKRQMSRQESCANLKQTAILFGKKYNGRYTDEKKYHVEFVRFLKIGDVMYCSCRTLTNYILMPVQYSSLDASRRKEKANSFLPPRPFPSCSLYILNSRWWSFQSWDEQMNSIRPAADEYRGGISCEEER